MRQRYAYGSNIAAVRCGWEDRIMSNGKLTDCGLQSGAVLWLRQSVARAFSSDSIEAIYLSLRAFARMRGNQPYMKLESWGFYAC